MSKNDGHLQQKIVVDKNGVQRKVWIDTGEETSNGYKYVREQDDDEKSIQSIISHPTMSQTDKIKGLLKSGISDKKSIAELTGAHYSRVCQVSKDFSEKQQAQENFNPDRDGKANEAAQQALEDPATPLPQLSVDERWDAYDLFSELVIEGQSKCGIFYGRGGTGKTYSLTQQLKAKGLVAYDEDVHKLGEDTYDYVKVTGKATTTDVYKAMFEHNGKLIIFDDCDSAISKKSTDTANMLKGALDTTGDGTIDYGSASRVQSNHPGARDRKGNTRGTNSADNEDGEDDSKYYLPGRFKFKGRMIFISNLSREEIPSPLVDSRALSIDLSMTAKETIDRLNKIKYKIPIENIDGTPMEGVTNEDRDAAVDFLDKYKDSMRLNQINGRTFGSIIKIKKLAERQGKDWQRSALITLG